MGEKSKDSYIAQAKKAALEGIELQRLRLVAFRFAIRGIQDHRSQPERYCRAIETLLLAIYEDLAKDQERCMMWGLMTQDESERKEVAATVYQKFLSDGKEIMSFLEPSRRVPGRYMTSDHDAFRKELDALGRELGLKIPDGDEDPGHDG